MHAHYNITDFSATPNINQTCTGPIQAAIDACSENGGGTVLCPAGTFQTGTLWLRDNVTLFLANGCTLLASANPDDYNQDDCFPEHEVFSFEKVSGAHLIIAYRVRNTGIIGQGCIHGHAEAFFDMRKTCNGQYSRPEWRPGQLLYFCLCNNIFLQDIRIKQAPYWTLFLHGCEHVRIRGLLIRNDTAMINNDGIDIDCCRNVTVSDCDITACDDAITLRAHTRPLGAFAISCENITITNCVLRSECNGIRIGVGEGTIRRCTLSNLVIHDSRIGINVISRYSDRLPGAGVTIEQIIFANLQIHAKMPLFISTGKGGKAPIRNLSFTDIIASSSRTSYIGGNPENSITNILLRAITLNMYEPIKAESFDPEAVKWHPEWKLISEEIPVALTIRYTKDITLEQVRFNWCQTATGWAHTLLVMDSQQLECTNCKLSANTALTTTIRAIRLLHARIIGCILAGGSKDILDFHKSPKESNVQFANNIIVGARETIVCDIPIAESGNIYA